MTTSHDAAAPVDGRESVSVTTAALAEFRMGVEEWKELQAEDVRAGRSIGELLAFLFFLLLVLMIGATWWTFRHQIISDDPHATASAVAE